MKLSEILFEGKHIWYDSNNGSEVINSFNINEFEKISEIAEMLEYLKKRSLHISSGSSRAVFAISPKRVIKLVGGDIGDDTETRSRWYSSGRSQNKTEYEIYNKSSLESRKILPKVYKNGLNFNWIMSELVRPLKSDKELQSLLKFNSEQYSKLMDALSFNGRDDRYNKFYSTLDLNQREFFDTLMGMLKEFGLQGQDLTSLDQWGKTSDGRLVLLDTGATKEVMSTYYKL